MYMKLYLSTSDTNVSIIRWKWKDNQEHEVWYIAVQSNKMSKI